MSHWCFVQYLPINAEHMQVVLCWVLEGSNLRAIFQASLSPNKNHVGIYYSSLDYY